MDFKVAGTTKGITAIQVDIKVDGLTPNIIKQAFAEVPRRRATAFWTRSCSRLSREPREDVSDWAPKMIHHAHQPGQDPRGYRQGRFCNPEASLLSPAQRSTSRTTAPYTIAAVKATDADKAKKMIEAIVKEPEPGEIYYGKVVRLMNFGAFVRPAAGQGRHGSHLQDG